MKGSAVSTLEQLDARLAANRAQNRARLLKAAEGHSGWLEAAGLLLAVLLVVVGLTQFGRVVGFDDFMRSGIAFVVLGLVLLISFQWSSTLRQRKALLELVKRLDQDR